MRDAAAAAFGPYLLDSRCRSLSRVGEAVRLASCEYEVLCLLVRRPNQVTSKDAIIRSGWLLAVEPLLRVGPNPEV